MYTMQITINGITYPVLRDVAHNHPKEVLAAMGVTSEAELQHGLDTLNVSDWYDADGKHLGPDINGLERFDLGEADGDQYQAHLDERIARALES